MLDKIKSLFVLEDEKATSGKTVGRKEETIILKKRVGVNSTQRAKPQATATGTSSAKFVNILSNALEKNNLDGFDYLEFRQSLKSLAAMQMDEKTMFQSAAAMAKTLNVTPQNLLTSAQHYLDVLAIEDQKFNEALKGQKQKKVGSKESDIKQMEKVVKDKLAKIKQLQAEIEKDQKQAANLRKEIDNATLKISQTQADFKASYENVVSRISNDVKNIKTYLVNKK